MSTIAAIATATGAGGIGIIRMSGEKCFDVLKKIFIPADKKWFARFFLSEILVGTLNDIDPKYPTVTKEKEKLIGQCKEYLVNEDDKIFDKK